MSNLARLTQTPDTQLKLAAVNLLEALTVLVQVAVKTLKVKEGVN